jgi:SAM-dependent methyltransferase
VETVEARAEGDYARLALHLLDLAKPQASEALIEVGCGTGALLRRIVRHTGIARVTGLDINSFLLKEARVLAVQEGLGDRLRFEEGSAEALPLPDNAFDVVYSCTVMEEVDADRMLAELVRIAKPGGRVAVGVRAVDRGPWTNLPLPAPLKEKIERPVGAAGGAGMHEHGCADESLYQRFRRAGLQAIEGGPAWAWARLADAWWQYNLAHQIRSMLTPAEDEVWLQTLRQAQAEDLPVWMARPFHCAVGTKP